MSDNLVTLQFTRQDIQNVLNALQERPFKEVAQTIMKIEAQLAQIRRLAVVGEKKDAVPGQ